MSALSSVRTLALDLPPSCIVFNPSHPDLFVVGTYHLHSEGQAGNPEEPQPQQDAGPTNKTAQRRTGSLILFRIDETANITQLQTLPTDFAVLDIQWTPHPERHDDILAVASSTGLVAFYSLHADSTHAPQLQLQLAKQVADPAILVLALAWHPTRPDVLGVTLSDGNVNLLDYHSDSPPSPAQSGSDVHATHEVYQHSLEAWTLAFTRDGTHVLSGGDDMVLQCSQLAADVPRQLSAATLLWHDHGRAHDAGVPAILPLSDGLVVTGSYDDHIRLLAGPTGPGRRRVLASLNLGGGVWRLKVLRSSLASLTAPARRSEDDFAAVGEGRDAAASPADPSPQTDTPSNGANNVVLLASCMHAGCRIVKLMEDASGSGESAWSFQVLARFEEHQSMNYGSDARLIHGGERRGETLVVSTSFYDKLLCAWWVDLDELEVQASEPVGMS